MPTRIEGAHPTEFPMPFDPTNLPTGTLVIFGRGRGEKTLGRITAYLPGTRKYKIEQLEARGSHRIGLIWTVPATAEFISEYTGPAPTTVPTTAIGQVKVFNARMFEINATTLGLPTDCKGKTFTFRGTTYRIIDLSPNRPKFPVSTERVGDNVPFKFKVNTVLAGLGLHVAPKELRVVTGLLAPSTSNLVGRTFRFRGRIYEVTDYVPSRPTYPYSVKRLPDGKPFRFDEASVTAGLLTLSNATTKAA